MLALLHKPITRSILALVSTLFSNTAPITYRVAAIQYGPTLGEKGKNISDLVELVTSAIEHGARLIVLPEMSTTGSCWISRDEIAPYTESIPGPTTERFEVLARQHDCYIALGMPEVDPDTQAFYNSMALVGPSGVIGTYRKLHSSISEPRWARDGDLGVPVWDTPIGRLSGLICMDAMYFEPARIAALHQADVLLFPMGWANERCPAGWWMARAFENSVYVIAANRWDKERGVQFNGGSCVLNPDGTIQGYLDDGNGIVYAEVDLSLARNKGWRLQGELLGHPLADRQPTEYQTVLQNSYLWEPLRYHSLYDLGELPAGQLSCAGIVQMNMQKFSEQTCYSHTERIQIIRAMLEAYVRDSAPAVPDILILPELLLPGPVPLTAETQDAYSAHFRQGAIQVPGPETEALAALASDLQISMVLGVAERIDARYYNTVLLIDPEGVYGIYRKLHLSPYDRVWATKGNMGLPIFDTPAGRIGLATGYDVLFPETLRVLANKGADLVCAPAFLAFPQPIGLVPTGAPSSLIEFEEDNPNHFLLWRIRAAEHNLYLALANWYGEHLGVRANGLSGIFSPNASTYPWPEVVADEGETGLMMMTIDTREQRTGRRTTRMLEYAPGDMAGSLTGELAYNILDGIPGNVVRSKPLLRKRQIFWYLDLVRKNKAPEER
jgi:predicted amidohydrolase